MPITSFYDDQDTEQTHTGDTLWTDIPGMVIPGSSLTSTNKYLIVARAFVNINSASADSRIRVQTDDDATIEAKSEHRTEHAASSRQIVYCWSHSFTTAASPSDVKMQFRTDTDTFTVRADQMSLGLLDLTAIGSEGTDYHEDIQADSGLEFSDLATTTVLASLAGATLGTTEYLILGYGTCRTESQTLWWDITAHAAQDSATATEASVHRGEGEKIGPRLVVGFALRHKASSGTPDVTIYGQEETTAANHDDGGAYLIALPTSLFTDFEYDYTAAGISANGETTIASIGPYTPTVDGNHWVFGMCNVETATAGLVNLHVEDGATEIRTGDSAITHTQQWDTAKDLEGARTFQQYSITGSTTLNLQGDRNAASNLEHRWLIVANLEALAGNSGMLLLGVGA